MNLSILISKCFLKDLHLKFFKENSIFIKSLKFFNIKITF